MKKIIFLVFTAVLIAVMALSVCAQIIDCEAGFHELLPEQWAVRPACGEIWNAFQVCNRCDYYVHTSMTLADHAYKDGVCVYCNVSESIGGGGTYDCSVNGHIYESGYCVICGAFDESMSNDWWCSVNQGDHFIFEGVCKYCGYVSCYHTEYGSWQIDRQASCKAKGLKYRLCLDCSYKQYEDIPLTDHVWQNGVCINCEIKSTDACSHAYVNNVCSKCGLVHIHCVWRTVIRDNDMHQNLCSCGHAYAVEEHSFVEDYTESGVANHVPLKKKLTCEVCGYECVRCSVNPVLNTHRISNNESITYASLKSYDCLFYEYTFATSGTCYLNIVDGAGKLSAKLALPNLSVGEKLLIDTKTGFYSIWSDKMVETRILIESSYVQDMAGVYYEFKCYIDEVEGYPFKRSSAYYYSAYPEVYNYPDIDSSKDGTGFDRDYPMIGHGSGTKVQLISFPQETVAEFKSDLDNYPLFLILYYPEVQSYNSVTSTSDAFIAAFTNLKANSGGSNSGDTGDMGGSYAQGYADAYNTLTNAVIEKAPFQGFVQGMWYGVLAMVTILGNGISIGGVSLFSVVISLLMLVVVAFVVKLLFKGAG